MATVTTVLPADTEAGDRVNLSHAVIIDTNILNIPDEFVTLVCDSEQPDAHTVAMNVADGWVVVDATGELPYDGNTQDDVEPQYA